MPRSEARLRCEMWRDQGWRGLSPRAQWLYLLLLSQPDVSMCGLLPLVEARWASMSAGATVETVSTALAELDEQRFVLVDRDTFEVLIRTFVRHDGVVRSEKTRKPMWVAWRAITSDRLRGEVLGQLGDHVGEAVQRGWLNPVKDGVSHGVPDGVSDTPSGGVSGGVFPVDNQPRDTPGTESLSLSESETLAADADATASKRPRDEIFDAVITAVRWDPAALTKSARGRVNAACKELRDLNASADEIAAAAREYRRRWPDVDCTPQGLTGNWALLLSDGRLAQALGPPCADCGAPPERHDDDFCQTFQQGDAA